MILRLVVVEQEGCNESGGSGGGRKEYETFLQGRGLQFEGQRALSQRCKLG